MMLIMGEAMYVWGQGYTRNLCTFKFCYKTKTALQKKVFKKKEERPRGNEGRKAKSILGAHK